ncbi:MAG: aspartyl/glutamyl-tRNA amidotransferase subunit C [Clostridiales bacterium]|jgi:aspartyl/glutamyl-tRNA(Asn/Gln) amidotransferase C subunit|nr:aspartyl/glutamyl-tRNA amidotransferase subunit C [Clostridiales bacterium]
MKSNADVEWLAELSKISFGKEELEKMSVDMESIMAIMDSLLDVKPVDFDGDGAFVTLDALRGDIALESFDPSLLVSQSKDATDGCFVIPKAL